MIPSQSQFDLKPKKPQFGSAKIQPSTINGSSTASMSPSAPTPKSTAQVPYQKDDLPGVLSNW